MGGGDLNLKKSWHPNTAKNQEKVWKAEQIDAAEKRKLAELQKEISDERNREELKRIGQNSGVLSINDDKKLEWMYKGSTELVNREEYLLGRVVDKTFEQLDAAEKEEHTSSNSVAPKNHVEHECIPFSIRHFKEAQQSSEQVDLARKLMEDPVMAIRQKEMESRRKILENPVKLKELHRLLKKDKSSNPKDKIKKHKKEKKSKKAKKSKRGSSNSESDSDDLDSILAQKYRKIQGVINQEDEDDKHLDLNKLLSMKYEKLSKELDKISKKHKKKKSHKSRGSDVSEDSENEKSQRGPRDRHRSPQSPNFNSDNRRSSNYTSADRYRNHGNNYEHRRREFQRNNYNNSNKYDERNHGKNLNRSRSPYRGNRNNARDSSNSRMDEISSRKRNRDRSRSRSNERSNRSHQGPDRHYNKPSNTKESTITSTQRSPSFSDSSSSSDSSKDSDAEAPPTKKFGLISATGKKLKIKKLTEEEKAQLKPAKTVKTKYVRPEKTKITEEEKERIRIEMQSNAEWREIERERNVKKYREEDAKESQPPKEFDHNFMTKQLTKAAKSETVASRIKSNLNNIQRSGQTMNSHFARR